MREDEDFDLDDFDLDGADFDFNGFEVETTNNDEEQQEDDLQTSFSELADVIENITTNKIYAKAHALPISKYSNAYFIPVNATDRNHSTSVDGSHPNDYGYTLWAESIEKPVLKILKKYGIK